MVCTLAQDTLNDAPRHDPSDALERATSHVPQIPPGMSTSLILRKRPRSGYKANEIPKRLMQATASRGLLIIDRDMSCGPSVREPKCG